MFVAICITCLTNDRRGGAIRPFPLKRWERLQQRKPQTHADRPGWAITPLRLFDRIYIHIPHPRVLRSEEPGMVSTCHAQTVRPSSVGMIPQLAPRPRKRRLASNAPYARRNTHKGFTYMLLRQRPRLSDSVYLPRIRPTQTL